jgi:hypothetical protein
MAIQVGRFVPTVGDAVERFRVEQSGLVDPELLDLCWQRIAEVVDGSAADDAPGLDARQKACLQLAEYFCYSPQSVTDEHVAEVLRHLPAQEALALTTSLWVADASLRLTNFCTSLGLAEDAP